MKKTNSISPSVYDERPRRGRSVLWKVATLVLLVVVIAQHSAYRSEGLLSRLKKPQQLEIVWAKRPLSPEQERTIREIAARGGTVHYDRYDGTINVSFAIGAPCEGCGQTAAFEPTGSPTEFSDEHLGLIEKFTVDYIDFRDSSVSTNAALACQRAHPKCVV